MNNGYFVKSERQNGYFCGKCGSRIDPQPNKRMLYCRNCRTGLDLLIEGESPAYYFRAQEQGLELKIVTPRMVFCNEKGQGLSEERRRVSDDSERIEKWLYSGIHWEELASILFRPGSREPLIREREWRKDLTLDDIASAIDKGDIKKAGSAENYLEIRKVFPGIQDIYSIRMFVHIYTRKGYRFELQPSGDTVQKLLSEELYVEDYRVSPAKWLAGQMEVDTAAPAVEEIARFYEELADTVEECDKSREDHECLEESDSFLATLHRIPAEQGEGQERYYLRVVMSEKKKKLVFLFSRDYTACSRRVNLKNLFKKSLFPVGDSLQAIRAYDSIYPGFHLMQYMNSSYNVFVPLLASDYHTGIELAAKAGAACVAERFHEMKISQQEPSEYKNIKKMTGLPVALLRKIPPLLAAEENFVLLGRMMRRRPEYIQLRRITSSVFFGRYDYWFSDRFYNRIYVPSDYRRMTAEENRNLRILRCISEHLAHTGLYLDYIRCCEELGQYVYGIEPSGRIHEAHDEVYKRLERLRWIKQMERYSINNLRFSEVVSDSSYIKLTTGMTENDRQYFEEDPYEIIAPKEMFDLHEEGQHMNNCVASYVGNVVEEISKIYFLRRKKNPAKSFGTIEVRKNCLIQAKGFGNHNLDRQAQLFVRKWCACKNLLIQTSDLYETA